MAPDDLAFDGDDEFAARLLGFGVSFGLRLFVEDHLNDAGAVAHVEKEQIAEVAAAMDPAHDDGIAAFVGGTKGAAVVCALQVAEKIQQVVLSCGRGIKFCFCTLASVSSRSFG